MRALLFALLLGACAGAPHEDLPPPQLPQRTGVDPLVAARAEGIQFRAVAEGVVVDIYREERIRLTRTPTGEELWFPKPQALLPRWNGEIFETAIPAHTLVVRIRDHRPCQSADAALFPIAVEVEFDGAQQQGCGRRF
jgi:hypothetical protein